MPLSRAGVRVRGGGVCIGSISDYCDHAPRIVDGHLKSNEVVVALADDGHGRDAESA